MRGLGPVRPGGPVLGARCLLHKRFKPETNPSSFSLVDEAATTLLAARKVGVEARGGADGCDDVAANGVGWGGSIKCTHLSQGTVRRQQPRR